MHHSAAPCEHTSWVEAVTVGVLASANVTLLAAAPKGLQLGANSFCLSQILSGKLTEELGFVSGLEQLPPRAPAIALLVKQTGVTSSTGDPGPAHHNCLV